MLFLAFLLLLQLRKLLAQTVEFAFDLVLRHNGFLWPSSWVGRAISSAGSRVAD
jgi:hypothetical protein